MYHGQVNLHGAAPFKQPSKSGNWHSQPPLIWRVRISLMQIDLLKAIGPEPAIILVRKRKHGDRFPLMRVNAFPDHPIMIGHFLVIAPALPLKSPTLISDDDFSSYPATRKGQPSILIATKTPIGGVIAERTTWENALTWGR
jgi:hypothetical protein